jgi:ABC-type Fe3+-hydroxamate transport system substrate-binding protein
MFIFLLFTVLGFTAEKSPSAVVTLSPALAELIYALKQEKLLVGVTDFTDTPEQARQLPSVGPYNKPLLEKIIMLQPDLVFVPQEGPEDIRFQLERAKLKYEIVSIQKLSDIPKAAQRMAILLGQPEVGSKFATHWENEIQAIAKTKKQTNKRTLIEIQKDPLIVAGGQTFLNEMIEFCGGKNIFNDFKGYPRISLELVVMRKPEIVFIAQPSPKNIETSVNYWTRLLKGRPARVVSINPDLLTRPGPRLLEGLKIVCRLMGGETSP